MEISYAKGVPERGAVPGADTTGPSEVFADVVLVIPPDHEHVRLARLTASGIGDQRGADVDRIEDLRLLVDEACALLLECAVPGDVATDRLTVTFRQLPAMVTVIVERRGAQLVDSPSPISAAVLTSISDHWALEDAPSVRFDLGIAPVDERRSGRDDG